MSTETYKKIRSATIEDARAWAASDEQFTFCIDFLEISAHDRFANIHVNNLEERFDHLIDQVDSGHGFANLAMYTDVQPFEIVRRVSDKCIELRPMTWKLAEGEKPEIIPGGFAGHCTNQRGLKYDIEQNTSAPTIRARLRKDGYYHSKLGRHVVSEKPRAFYDYNF